MADQTYSLKSNIGWNVAANLSGKVIEPLFAILVARLLTPADYGVFAIAIALKAFFEIFKDLGLRSAVILNQDKNLTSVQFSIQILVAIFSAVIILKISQPISDYLDMPIAATVIPYVGILLILSAFEEPIFTDYLRNNNYKPLFLRQTIPALCGGASSLWFAYNGHGVMSLIWGQVLGRFTSLIYLAAHSRSLPKWNPEWSELSRLFVLGKHLTFQQICGYLVLQADSLIVGKNLGAHHAGNYKMANMLATLLPSAILGHSHQAFFTDCAKNKNDMNHLTKRYNQFLIGAFLFNIVHFILLFFLAPIFVPLILGNQWEKIVPLVQLVGVSVISSYLVNHNNAYSQLIGFYRVYSYFSLFRAIATILVVAVASLYSLNTLIISWVAVGMVANILNHLIFRNAQNELKITNSIFWMFSFAGVIYVTLAFRLANSS